MSELGRPIMEHRARRRERAIYAILAIVGLIVGTSSFGFGVYRWAFAFSNYGPAVVLRWAAPWLVIGLVFLVLGIIGAGWLIRWNWLSVTTFESGLQLRRGSRIRLIRWTDVQTILVSGVRYGIFGVIWGTRSALSLQMAGNHRLRLTDTLAGLNQLIATAKQYVYPRLLTETARFLRDGQPVSFGPLQLHPEGLHKGARRLSWAEIESAQLKDGQITIHTLNRGPRLRAAVRRVPNAEICLQLIQHYATGARRGT